jgi:cardiolipin synthase (CMP-forming)
VWLIITHKMAAAFVLFLLAGLSHAADGYLAKRFRWHTELGAYRDPIADKALLVSIYVTLGFANHLPVWLVITVVSRDILIIGAFILSWILSRPVTVYPLLVSKANTVAQLVLASLVLAELGLGLEPFVAVGIWSRARSLSVCSRVFLGRGSSTWRAMSLSLRCRWLDSRSRRCLAFPGSAHAPRH